MIRLQTSKRRDIPNAQGSEIAQWERNWAETIPERHPNVCIRTGLSPVYKCFGLVFASRRTKITQYERIQTILEHDKYKQVEQEDVLPGDIILYFEQLSSPDHVGIVVYNDGPPLHNIKVCSKWGNGPEVVHWYSDVPEVYGPNHRFYRCHLSS